DTKLFELCMLMETKNLVFFFSSRRRHTRFDCDWSSDVCSSDLHLWPAIGLDSPLAQLVARQLGLGGDEAMGELGLGHLEREQGDREPVLHRRVLGDVRGERRLA